jgi:hypothetical protein
MHQIGEAGFSRVRVAVAEAIEVLVDHKTLAELSPITSN